MVLRARADPFGVGQSQADPPTYANLIDYRANLGRARARISGPTRHCPPGNSLRTCPLDLAPPRAIGRNPESARHRGGSTFLDSRYGHAPAQSDLLALGVAPGGCKRHALPHRPDGVGGVLHGLRHAGSRCRCPSSGRSPRTSARPRHHRTPPAPLAWSDVRRRDVERRRAQLASNASRSVAFAFANMLSNASMPMFMR